MVQTLTFVFSFAFFLLSFSANASDNKTFICGIAEGYPPYQYANLSKEPAGFDVKIAQAIFAAAHLNLKFHIDTWDKLVPNIIHNTEKIDFLCGAEISNERSEFMAFSDPIYNRYSAIFVLEKSSLAKIQDLYGKFVTGDKDSFFEKSLGKDLSRIRIIKTQSKAESFKMLKSGKVVAVIAPEEVGHHLAKEMNLKVKTLGIKDPGSPVALATSKEDRIHLKTINSAIQKIKANKSLESIIPADWIIQ